jgi:hypothetical protein
MSRHIPRPELERLSKLCGLFGSDHAGERASAAAKADQLVRKLGLTWSEVLISAPRALSAPASIKQKIDLLYANRGMLNAKARDFIANVSRYPHRLSDKQVRFVDRLFVEITEGRRAA